jgi:bifunctional non-homologous end joining protein LigD
MLSNVKPMPCKLVKEPFDRRGWIFEIKWDGFRSIAEIAKSEVRLYSRNQRSFTRQFSEVVSSLERLSRRHEAVLDGELVALDGEGKSRFEWLIRRKSGRGQIVYLVFDLLYLDGQDLRNLPLIRRKGLLKKLVRSIPNVRYVDHIEEQGQQFFKLAVQQGLEGIVAKDGQSPYVSGVETWYWLKIKNRQFQRKEPIDFHKKQQR